MLYKRNLGKKFTCHGCGTRFYDLGRAEPRCPHCNADPADNPITDPRTAAMARVKAESASKKGGRYEPDAEEDAEAEPADDEEIGDLDEEDDETGEEEEESESEADFDDL